MSPCFQKQEALKTNSVAFGEDDEAVVPCLLDVFSYWIQSGLQALNSSGDGVNVNVLKFVSEKT